MSPAPAWWRALGGPWCISVWSGIVGGAFVIPSAIWTTVYSPLTFAEAALAEVLAAAVSILFLWLAHAWWLSPRKADQPHRAVIAVSTFAVVGLVRLMALFEIGRASCRERV